MLNPDILLDRAINTEDKRLQAQCLNAAFYMTMAGIKEADTIGHIGTLVDTLKAGQTVKIRKGAVIHSYREASRGVSKRVREVTIHRVDKGYISSDDFESIIKRGGVIDTEYFRQACIYWAGAGGYWCWTDVNNVEM